MLQVSEESQPKAAAQLLAVEAVTFAEWPKVAGKDIWWRRQIKATNPVAASPVQAGGHWPALQCGLA